MTYDDWCDHIEQVANKVLGTKMINWREVEFNWAERFRDGDPDATTADALIVAAQAQLAAAIKEAVDGRPLFPA